MWNLIFLDGRWIVTIQMKQITSLLKLCALLLLFTQVHLQDNLYKLALLSQERGAACLDGTPPAIYYHLGSGVNRNKFMIFYEGGGFCAGFTAADVLQSCYKRSNGNLGTTKNAPPTYNFDKGGLLATDKALNPVFYDWTKIFVVYCDGSEYSGTKADPISYKDKQLYFRGYNNTMEGFYYLDKEFDFYNSEAIVITGVSAGGIATFLYSNYLVENTKKAKVYAIPDSGLFVTEYFSPFAGMETMKAVGETLFKITLSEGVGYPIPECLSEFDGFYHCYNAGNLAKYLKAPMFIVESPYDQQSIDNIVFTDCTSNSEPPYSIQNCNQTIREAIEEYRRLTFAAVEQIRGSRSDVGAWMPACVQHGFTGSPTFNDPAFKVDELMPSAAIAEFLADPLHAKLHVDQVPWPYNAGCSGQSGFNLLRG